jgi:hypothetical protein
MMSDWTVVATKKVLPAGNQALAAPTDNYELEQTGTHEKEEYSSFVV